MSFIINQGFSLKSPQFNFERDYFKDVATLKAASEDWFPDFFITNVGGVLYQLNKSNSVDATTGRWRKFSTGDATEVKADNYINRADMDTYFGDKEKPVSVNVTNTMGAATYVDGQLTVFHDESGHVVYQEYVTSNTPSTSEGWTDSPMIALYQDDEFADITTGGHTDGRVIKYVRVYNRNAPNLTSPEKGKWSKWKVVDWYSLAPKASDSDKSLGKALLTQAMTPVSADGTVAGAMSVEDKKKLDAISASATADSAIDNTYIDSLFTDATAAAETTE